MPSIPDRLLALENAQALAQARRLLLLKAILAWLDDHADNTGYLALRQHVIDRIAEEGP